MTDADMQSTEPPVDQTVSGLVKAMQVLASPARAMYQVILNSQVTSFTLLAYGIIVSVTIGANAYYFKPTNDAELRALWKEQARNWQLKNEQLAADISSTSVPIEVWKLASLSIDSNGVNLVAPRISQAAKLRVLWRIPTMSFSGIHEFEVLTDQVSIALPSETFGAAWAPNNVIIFDMEQVLADGRVISFTGRDKTLVIR